MNIFMTSPDPKACALVMDDRRLIKMVLETAQLLSTAFRLQDMGELEELVPVANYYDNVDYCGHSDKTRHLTAGTREPVGELFETSVYLRTLRDMRSTYTSKNPSKSCNWDIHGDNVMMRGAQPVITDPLSAS
ncbi:hypothetical protein SPS_10 [Sphingomonas phage Scott]|uniref:Uncharacterized protein n=1 Tax=Sphingomonas phage Scott TaxID=2282912 RepID=A0A346FDA7_9CAUD|nr:DNA binding protein [Sphingomonas phage Scott]AXN53721.1 hypothetical protein SPS_10 [Sphingomonas phage Scott]